MNEIVKKFLLVEDKLMVEMHFRQPGFIYSACGPFTKKNKKKNKKKTKKEYKNLKKQDIHNIFIKMNQIKLVFNMTWLMEILKIYRNEQLLIKHCMINI